MLATCITATPNSDMFCRVASALFGLRASRKLRHASILTRASIPCELLAIELTFLAITLSVLAAFPADLCIPATTLAWALLALSWVDAKLGRLPDLLTVFVGIFGLALARRGRSWPSHFIGLTMGFLLPAAIAWTYRAWRGRDGLGFGDVKLMAAIGALVGWQGVPFVLLFASLAGIVFVVIRALLARGHFAPTERLPFGPFLCLSGWMVWAASATGWGASWLF